MLLSNALDSIAPEEQQPILAPPSHSLASSSSPPYASPSPNASPNTSSTSLSITPPSNNSSHHTLTRGNRALTFLTLKRDPRVTEKTKITFLAACRVCYYYCFFCHYYCSYAFVVRRRGDSERLFKR